MTSLSLEIGTPGHDALAADWRSLIAFHAWLKSAPDPLRNECTRIDLLDESGTLFRCTHWVKDEAGKLILDGEPCPTNGVHPFGYRCHNCDGRHVRQAVTVVATAEPLPACVLPYLAPSSAEGTPNQWATHTARVRK